MARFHPSHLHSLIREWEGEAPSEPVTAWLGRSLAIPDSLAFPAISVHLRL
jgi:hypothetical protein